MIETAAGPRRVGIMFDRDRPPEELAGFARAVEDAGADDLWLVEDLRWAGSIASAAIALTATTTLRVGIGIAPAPLRNPALLAMEVGTLARLHPGRLVAGLGHGATELMRDAGALVANRMDLLAETATALRGMLRGEEVTVDGKAVQLDRVRLVHPPEQAPPLVLGVVGPRSLRLSGRVADGTLVVEGNGPRDLPRIRALIDEGVAGRGAAGAAHEILATTYLVIDDDPARVQADLAPIRADLAPFRGVPEDEVFAAAGDDREVVRAVHALWQAGADAVVLHPVGATSLASAIRALTALREHAA